VFFQVKNSCCAIRYTNARKILKLRELWQNRRFPASDKLCCSFLSARTTTNFVYRTKESNISRHRLVFREIEKFSPRLKMKKQIWTFSTIFLLIFAMFAQPLGAFAQGDDEIIGGSSSDISTGASVFVLSGGRRRKQPERTAFHKTVAPRTPQARNENRRERITQSSKLGQNKPPAYKPSSASPKEMGRIQAAIELVKGANVYLAEKNYDEAGNGFADAMALDPKNTDAKFGMARVYSMQGDAAYEQQKYERAAAFYEMSLRFNEQNADVYASMGDVYDALDQREKAIKSYEKALELNPKLTALAAPLGVLEYEIGDFAKAANYLQSPSARVDAKAQDAYAISLARLERDLEAQIELKQAIEKNPNNAETFYYAGVVADRIGQTAEAITHYQNAVRLNPNFAEAFHNLGAVYYNRGEYRAAADNYKKAVDIKSNYAAARIGLADAYRQLERWSDAINQYQIINAAKPEDADVMAKFGYVLGKNKEWKRAVELLTKAAQKQPNAANYTNLAWAYNGDKNFAEGKRNALEAIKRDPDFAAAYFNLGNAQAQLKEFSDAEASFKKALALKKDWAEALNNLGFVYGSQNDWKRAVQAHQAAVNAAPDSVSAHYNLGVANLRLGNRKNAERERDALVRLNAAGWAQRLDAMMKNAAPDNKKRKN
jgi:tetratricopeptide (TPR) repeat protein